MLEEPSFVVFKQAQLEFLHIVISELLVDFRVIDVHTVILKELEHFDVLW